MRILIAVPTFETIYPETYRSVYRLDGGEHELDFDFIKGYDVATARNKIAKKALDTKADYVLMVDNDVVLPKDALLRMLEEPRDVCLGYYPPRPANGVYDGRVALFKLGKGDYTTDSFITAREIGILKDRGATKVEVRAGGMGCALIKTDVFEKVPTPWFKWIHYAGGHTLSEDLYFCDQCRGAGIKVYADARVACGHIFRHTQWPSYEGEVLYEGERMYKVLKTFDDLMDVTPVKGGNVPYRYDAGDLYPRQGAKPSLARIAELASDQNLRGEPLIAPIVAETKPKRRRKKAVEKEKE